MTTTAPAIVRIRLGDLVWKTETNRTQRPTAVARLKGNYDQDAVGVIVVNRRADGSMVVIEGGHRCETMHQLGLDDELVTVEMFQGLSVERENDLASKYSARLAHSSVEKFLLKVRAGAPAEVDITRMLALRGYVVGSDGSRTTVRCAGALLYAYTNGNLAEVLDVILYAWPSEDGVLQNALIRGVSSAMVKWPSLRSPNELARKLRAQYATGHALVGFAGQSGPYSSTALRLPELVGHAWNFRRKTRRINLEVHA